MQNRFPVRSLIEPIANYAKLHSDKCARDGANMPSLEESANRRNELIRCTDTMTRSSTYDDSEDALRHMHRIGMFPPNVLVYQVASAFLMAD